MKKYIIYSVSVNSYFAGAQRIKLENARPDELNFEIYLVPDEEDAFKFDSMQEADQMCAFLQSTNEDDLDLIIKDIEDFSEIIN